MLLTFVSNACIDPTSACHTRCQNTSTMLQPPQVGSSNSSIPSHASVSSKTETFHVCDFLRLNHGKSSPCFQPSIIINGPQKRQSIFIPVNHGWPAQSLDGTWTNNAQQNRNMFIRTNSYKYYLDKRSYKIWCLSRSKRRVRAVSTWAQPPQKGPLEVHQN